MTAAPDAASLATFRDEIAAGRRIGVAVSGGGDSVALLTMLTDAFGAGSLAVATVDHGLRPEARSEADGVGARCRDIGASHDVLTWSGWDGNGNLQARARIARYGLLADWARGRGIGFVALGHTRDDVAETVLLGLARSAGLDGLSGMARQFAHGGIGFLRPLLDAGRNDLRGLLASRGIGWIEDPSNDDPRFDRVRMRRALRMLDECGVTAGRIAASAGHLAQDRAAIRAQLRDWSSQYVRQAGGDLCIDRAALGKLAPSLSRRLAGMALRWVSGAPYAARWASLGTLVEGGRGTLSGCLVSGEPGVLRVAREPAAADRSPAVALDQTWDGRWRVDGPADPGARIAALGARGLAELPNGPPRSLPPRSLAAGPAIWRGARLVAAPLAGYGPYTATLAAGRDDFVTAIPSY